MILQSSNLLSVSEKVRIHCQHCNDSFEIGSLEKVTTGSSHPIASKGHQAVSEDLSSLLSDSSPEEKISL